MFLLAGLPGFTQVLMENMHSTQPITTDQSIQGDNFTYIFPVDTTLTGRPAQADIAVTGKLDMTHAGIRALIPATRHGLYTNRQVGSMVFGQWTQV